MFVRNLIRMVALAGAFHYYSPVRASIATLPFGDLLIAEQNNWGGHGGIVKVGANSGSQSVVWRRPQLPEPEDVLLEAQGTMLVLDGSDKAIYRVNPHDGSESLLSSFQHLFQPRAMTLGFDGSIYVADGAARIVKVNPQNGVQSVFKSGGPLVNPWDITTARDGSLLIADLSGKVFRMDVVSAQIAQVSDDPLLRVPVAIVVAPNGDIFVGTNDQFIGHGGVVALNSSGLARTIASPGSFFSVAGIEFDQSGQLFVSDQDYFLPNHRSSVFRLNVDTGIRSTLATGGLLVSPGKLTVIPEPSAVGAIVLLCAVRCRRSGGQHQIKRRVIRVRD